MEYPVAFDYSNPQQGSFSPLKMQNHHPRKVFAVPPTRKDDRKLFVGGLPSNVTDEEFREFFEQFGRVVDSVVMFDRDTHRSRGFGFITFEDPNVSRHLLEMSVEGVGGGQNGSGRVEMRGKVCEIKPAEPKEASASSGKGRRGSKGYNRSSAYQQKQYAGGYPPSPQAGIVSSGDGSPVPPGAVNPGVPNTLPMPNHQPVMYPPYGMGAYYHHHLPEGMHVYPPTYVGYPPPPDVQPSLYYPEQGNIDQHYGGGIPSVMTATTPGPQTQNGAQNGFAPTANQMQSTQADENGEEAEQS